MGDMAELLHIISTAQGRVNHLKRIILVAEELPYLSEIYQEFKVKTI
jgi:ABC-type transporter Mla MlaB component